MKIIDNNREIVINNEMMQKSILNLIESWNVESHKIEPNQVRYMIPKRDRNRVFNFVKCEYYSNEFEEWFNGYLYVSLANYDVFQIATYEGLTEEGFKFTSSKIRIQEFTPENPPPVDTLVKVWGDNFWVLRHFCNFDNNTNHIRVFDSGATSEMSFSPNSWKNWSFVSFDESNFEWID